MSGSDEINLGEGLTPPPPGARAPEAGPVTPMLYRDIQPISPDAHGELGLSTVERPYDFAAEANAVPITAQEFPFAMRFFPIVFSGGDQPLPLAVLGISKGENLFVEADGDWTEGVYIPAYIRRYPFVLATDDGEQRFALAIDPTAPHLSATPQHRFFEGTEPTAFLTDMLEFCKQYQHQHLQTRSLIDALKRHDLTAIREVQVPRGEGEEPQTIGRYIGVDQKRLDELSNEAFLDLRDVGALPWIYFHLASGLNWERLLYRTQMRARQAAGQG